MRTPSRLALASGLPAALLAAALAPGPALGAGPVVHGPGALVAADPADPTVAEDGSTVRRYPGGPAYVVEPVRPPTDGTDGVSTGGTTSRTDGRQAAARTAYPEAQTFRLHSRPGARRTIYLDFDGAHVAGTWWNEDIPDATYGGLDADGAPGSFSADEKAVVQEVWQRVAEDYAPFEVDVTTEDPGAAALLRSRPGDQVFGVHAVVTRSTLVPRRLCGEGCVGVAFVDVFDQVSSGRLGPVWAFSTPLRNDPVQIAETLTHEVGHTLGLLHDGVQGGNDYYAGQGIWSPVMGAGTAALTQWSRGEYAGAVNRRWTGQTWQAVPLQDDLAVMAAGGIPRRADDHGPGPAAASHAGVAASGVVERSGDVDAFAVQQGCAGALGVSVTPAPVGPNLDVRVRVLDADGQEVAAADPPSADSSTRPGVVATGLDARLEVPSAPAGRYTVLVDGVGHGDPQRTGYSRYGSLGAFTVRATPACAADLPTSPTAVTASWDDATRSAILRWSAPASAGSSQVTGWVVRRVGGDERTVAGASTARTVLTDLAPGTHELAVAAVTAAGTGREARVRVVVPAPATRPQAPTRPRATPGPAGGRLTVLATWRAAVSPTAPLTGNRVVVQRLSSSGRVLATSRMGAGPSATRLSLQLPRGRYRFRVVALNRAGASAPSAWSGTASAR